MSEIRKKDDFSGQILHVIPRPLVAELAQHFLLHQLMVTDIGWYPQARYHFRERLSGAPENILILCVSGSGWLEIDRIRYPVQAHEVVVIPRNLAHSYGAADENPWSIHWVHLQGSVADYFVSLLPEHVYRVPVSTGGNGRSGTPLPRML